MFFYIIFIVFIIFVLSLYFTSNYLLSLVTSRKLHNEEESLKKLANKKILNMDLLKSLDKEDIFITSKDSLKLHGVLVKNPQKTDKFIILIHGVSIGYVGSLKYIESFYNRGFNILIISQRRHGKSEGKYSTYGYYEKYDLDCWVEYLINRFGNEIYLGLHGESMGAGTVLQYPALNKHVKFIIADCGYSDMITLIKFEIKHDFPKYLHAFLLLVLKLSRIRALYKAKFDFFEVSPIKVVEKTELPILFIHGKEDYFVPWHMSVDMYEKKLHGYRQLLLVDKAEHANSIEVNKKLYEEAIDTFFKEIQCEE